MKKLLFILFILFTSCEKNSQTEPVCWDCVFTMVNTYSALYYEGPKPPDVVETVVEKSKFCDQTEQFVRELEIRETKTIVAQGSEANIVSVRTMVCTK